MNIAYIPIYTGASDKLSGRTVGFRTFRYPAGFFWLSGRTAGILKVAFLVTFFADQF